MNDIQKAIDLLKIINHNAKSSHAMKDMWDGVTDKEIEEYQEDFNLINTAIEILEEKLNSGWISCDMDLPTISTEDMNRGVSRISVLAISKHRKDTMIRQFDIEDRKFYDGGYGVGVVDNSIVAWQMLPKKSEWRVKR